MAIMREAVRKHDYTILAQGIVAKDRIALNASEKAQETAIALLRKS